MDTSLLNELRERRRSRLQTSSENTTQNTSATLSFMAKPTAEQEAHREQLEKAKAKREKLAELEQMKMKTAQLKAAISTVEGQIAETTNAIRELKSQLAFAIQMSGKNANKGG